MRRNGSAGSFLSFMILEKSTQETHSPAASPEHGAKRSAFETPMLPMRSPWLAGQKTDSHILVLVS